MLKMESGEVNYVDYHQKNDISTSYLMASKLPAIERTQRRFIAKDILISLRNLEETSE